VSNGLAEFTCWLVCAGGTAGCLLGLLGVLTADRLRRSWTGAVLLVALGLAGAAAAGYAGGVPRVIWLPVAGLAAVAAAAVAAPLTRSAMVARACCRARDCLAGPRGTGAVLLVASAGFLWWGVVFLDPALPNDLPRTAFAHTDADQLHDVVPSPAVTDRGRPIRLEFSLQSFVDAAPLEQSDLLHERNLAARLIRTAPADPAYNCHGWVFTGGHYWIRGQEVERLLADNGYREVSPPAVGDVAVVRGPEGTISHSALVRVASAGLLLVESKWGRQGRYVHRPEDTPYPGRWSYYRSARPGHLLRGLAADPAGPSAGVP
jgi:hypothetical protein